MKKVISILTALAMIVACQEEPALEDPGSKVQKEGKENTENTQNTEEPQENYPEAFTKDAAAIHGNGGVSWFEVTAAGAWTISSDSDWLSVTPTEGSERDVVTVKTLENTTGSIRSGKLTVSSGEDTQIWVVKQRPIIISRYQKGSKTMTNGIRLNYSGTVWSRIYSLLPVPQTNQYQEITDFSVEPGTVYDCQDGVNRYVVTDLTSDFPASGQNLVTETFQATVYEVSADLDKATDIPDYDPDTVICDYYLGKETNGLIDPTNAEIVSTANELWNASDGNLVTYARKCYDWTAENMKYGNMNTGLHTVEDLMRTKLGDCGNFCSVFISLLRAKGIPARHIVMISPNENGYHVRAEFYLPAYGWIPVDPTFHKDDPNGNYFGKFNGVYIVTSLGINNICMGPDGEYFVASLMQSYWLWYWWSKSGSGVSDQHVFSNF